MFPADRTQVFVQCRIEAIDVVRAITVVGHILFPTPDQLDRITELAGDIHCLKDKI
ncbi:hypothetical protein D3C85_1849690 [compost metagenome]